MARRPRPGSGSGRQTATAGLLLPARQEGTRRAGWLLRASACAPGVSPRSRALPERLSPCLVGGLGLTPGFLGPVSPPSLPPLAVGRKGQQWEAGPALAPAGGPAAAGWDGGELSCPVTWPEGRAGTASPTRSRRGHRARRRRRGRGTGCGDEASQRFDLPVPCARFVLGRGLRPGTAGWHKERGLGSRDPRLPGHTLPSSSSPVSGVGPAGAVADGKLPKPNRSAGFWGGEKAARGSPAASAGWRPPGTGRRLFPTAPALLAGSAGSGGKPDTLPCGWGAGGAGPTPSGPPQTRCRGAGPGLPPAVDGLGSSVRHLCSPSGSSGLRSIPTLPGGGDPEPPSSPLTCLLGASSWIRHQIRTSHAINQPATRPCVVYPYGGSPNWR